MKRTTTKRKPTKARFNKLKLIIFDFDGVFTDNFIYIADDNSELKKFFVPDGVGIWLLHQAELDVAIVTGNNTKTTAARAKRLQIKHVYQNIRDKTEVYEELKHKFGLTDAECLYMGDDLTDLRCMKRAGISVATADAHPEIKKVAHWITKHRGGHGAIREVAEAILVARGKLLIAFE